MSTFAQAFINIMTEAMLPRPTSTNPALPEGDFKPTLQAAIDRALSRSDGRGGVLWFPPGLYRVSTGWIVPETMTLSFAPGAQLILVAASPSAADVLLEVRGLVDAEPRQIFSTPANLPAGIPSGVATGRVVFTGISSMRILPEWWGAARGSTAEPEVDTAALQAAIRAAILDRETLTSATSLPVFLGGRYRINQTILVAPTPGAGVVRDAILEGLATPGGASTIGYSPTPDSQGLSLAMFTFIRVQNLSLTNLAFDAAGAPLCVWVIASLDPTDTLGSKIQMRQCSWINGLAGQVAVQGPTSTASRRASVSASFFNCLFGGAEAASTPTGGSGHVALSFATAIDGHLLIAGCVFNGISARAIRMAGGGTLESMGCRFEIIESESSIELEFKTTTDIELTQLTDTGASSALQMPLLSAGSQVAEPELQFPSFAAWGCVSGSPSFLRAIRRDPGTAPRNESAHVAARVTLSGVVHRRGTRGASIVHDQYDPPAVIWEEGGLARTTLLARTFLTMTACSFDDDPSSARNVRTPRVFASADLRFAYNVGTFRSNAELAAEDASTSLFSFSLLIGLARSLGSRRAVDGPFMLVLRPLPDRVRTGPYAWATWL